MAKLDNVFEIKTILYQRIQTHDIELSAYLNVDKWSGESIVTVSGEEESSKVILQTVRIRCIAWTKNCRWKCENKISIRLPVLV